MSKRKKQVDQNLGRWQDSPATEAEEEERQAVIRSECEKIRSTWSAVRMRKSGGALARVYLQVVYDEFRLREPRVG